MAEVVAAVRACFESEALCERMEQWAEANAVEIDLHRPMSDGSGHPLRYTQLHREWCDLVETALEAAVEQAGGNVRDFYQTIKEGQDARLDAGGGAGGAWANDAAFIGLVNATVSFDFWLEMMQETAMVQREGVNKYAEAKA